MFKHVSHAGVVVKPAAAGGVAPDHGDTPVNGDKKQRSSATPWRQLLGLQAATVATARRQHL